MKTVSYGYLKSYADDTVLVAEAEEVLRKMAMGFKIVCDNRELNANDVRDKVLRLSDFGGILRMTISLDRERLE